MNERSVADAFVVLGMCLLAIGVIGTCGETSNASMHDGVLDRGRRGPREENTALSAGMLSAIGAPTDSAQGDADRLARRPDSSRLARVVGINHPAEHRNAHESQPVTAAPPAAAPATFSQVRP